MYRDDLRLRPARTLLPHRDPGRRHRRQGRGPRRRRPLLRPHHPRRARRAQRPRPPAARSSSPSSSTAATASCRSAPTSSARTCPPRWPRRSRSGSRRPTARRRDPDAKEDDPMKQHLLERGRPDPRRRAADPRHRRGAAVAGGPADQEAARAARPHRRQPLLRGLHPHPDLVRGGRQAAVGRRHQLLRQGLQRLQGRVAQGHRADPRGDGRRRGRHPPRRLRRAAPAGHAGWIALQRHQRRRRHPRAPHPGAARRVHDAPPPRRRSTAAGSRSSATCCTAGWPAPTCCCCRRSAPRSPWSRRRRCCRSASTPGRARRPTTSTRCCPRPTR